jgi:hypothetical protein
MTIQNKTKDRFKVRGADIIGHTLRPASMKAFVNDSLDEENSTHGSNPGSDNAQNSKSGSAQTRICADTQEHNNTDESSTSSEPTARLHIQLRKDLAYKLLETVLSRKRGSGNDRERATQRAIIEEALDEYFVKRGI